MYISIDILIVKCNCILLLHKGALCRKMRKSSTGDRKRRFIVELKEMGMQVTHVGAMHL